MTGRLRTDSQSGGYAVAAVLLVLLSGAVMVLAGVLAHADGWAVGAAIAIAGGGLVIMAAFVLELDPR